MEFVRIFSVHLATHLVEFEREIFCEPPRHTETCLIPAIIMRKVKQLSSKISFSFVPISLFVLCLTCPLLIELSATNMYEVINELEPLKSGLAHKAVLYTGCLPAMNMF